MQKINFENI